MLNNETIVIFITDYLFILVKMTRNSLIECQYTQLPISFVLNGEKPTGCQ